MKKTDQPELPVNKDKKPSLAIGTLESAYELAAMRIVKYVTLIVKYVAAVIEHGTPSRKEQVLERVTEMQHSLIAALTPGSVAFQLDLLREQVVAERNANLEGERPKFIRKVVEALTGLGLDVNTASEFIDRKRAGTAFEDDEGVHDQILLDLGLEPATLIDVGKV